MQPPWRTAFQCRYPIFFWFAPFSLPGHFAPTFLSNRPALPQHHGQYVGPPASGQ